MLAPPEDLSLEDLPHNEEEPSSRRRRRPVAAAETAPLPSRPAVSSAPWKVSPPGALRGDLPMVAHYKEKVRAAFIALFRGDELLLVRGKFSGLWQLPGGLVDMSDASVWEAATREFYEETGSQAPLPAVDLVGWFETGIDLRQGVFHGVTLVLRMKTAKEIPIAPSSETSEGAFVKWSELDTLTYRWPNDQTIPMIYDKSHAADGARPVVRQGPWSESRPVLQAGGAGRECAADMR